MGEINRYLMSFMKESEYEVTYEILESVCPKVNVQYNKCIQMEEMDYYVEGLFFF